MSASADVTIVDYGMGNLRSVSKAVESLGYTPVVSSRAKDIAKASRVILPGVGAFAKAMAELKKRKLLGVLCETIRDQRPFLGICLGLQLLFEESEEGGRIPGLGVFAGRVIRFRKAAKIPHMGWNQVHYARKDSKDCPLLKNVTDGSNFYFVHSYYPILEDRSLSCLTTRYGEPFTSMIWRGNIFASQFHPEKSQRDGLAMLDAFLSLKAA